MDPVDDAVLITQVREHHDVVKGACSSFNLRSLESYRDYISDKCCSPSSAPCLIFVFFVFVFFVFVATLQISWDNFTTVATIGGFYLAYFLLMAVGYMRERRARLRRQILASFGQEELPEAVVICSTAAQLLQHKAREGMTKDHQWISVAYTRDDAPFNFYMKVSS